MNKTKETTHFEVAGKKERDKFAAFAAKNGIEGYTFSDEFGYSKHDVTWGDCICEIKCREGGKTGRHDDAYYLEDVSPRDAEEAIYEYGYLIEKDKYDYLINSGYKNVYYINFFSNGYLIFNLREPKWTKTWYKKLCNKTTCDGGLQKVIKMVGMLGVSHKFL